jgi:hypothetical protein
MTNHRATVGPITTWLLTRVVGGCQHSISVTYNNRHEPSPEVARRIWRARRQLQIACEQQRDAIRIQQQLHHHY